MSIKLMPIWNKLRTKPLGPWLFDKLISRQIPYTGSIKANVVQLEPGKAQVVLKDRRGVRNHLNSIHAIAQINLAEYCSGLAMTARLSENERGIVTQLRMHYHKKARGRLTAHSTCPPFEVTEAMDIIVKAQIYDESGDLVSEAEAYWRVSPKKPAS